MKFRSLLPKFVVKAILTSLALSLVSGVATYWNEAQKIRSFRDQLPELSLANLVEKSVRSETTRFEHGINRQGELLTFVGCYDSQGQFATNQITHRSEFLAVAHFDASRARTFRNAQVQISDRKLAVCAPTEIEAQVSHRSPHDALHLDVRVLIAGKSAAPSGDGIFSLLAVDNAYAAAALTSMPSIITNIPYTDDLIFTAPQNF